MYLICNANRGILTKDSNNKRASSAQGRSGSARASSAVADAQMVSVRDNIRLVSGFVLMDKKTH